MTIFRFDSVLGHQLIINAARLIAKESLCFPLPILQFCNQIPTPRNVTEKESSILGEVQISSLSIRSETDVNNMIHHLVKLALKVDEYSLHINVKFVRNKEFDMMLLFTALLVVKV